MKKIIKFLLGLLLGTTLPSIMAWGYVQFNNGLGQDDIFLFMKLSLIFAIMTHGSGVVSRHLNLGSEQNGPFFLLNSFLKGLIVSGYYVYGVCLFIGARIGAFDFPLLSIYLFSASVHQGLILRAYSPHRKKNWEKAIRLFPAIVVVFLLIPSVLSFRYAVYSANVTYEYFIQEDDFGHYELLWGQGVSTDFHVYKTKEIEDFNFLLIDRFQYLIELKKSGTHKFQEKKPDFSRGESIFYIIRDGEKIKLDVYRPVLDGWPQGQRDLFIWDIEEGRRGWPIKGQTLFKAREKVPWRYDYKIFRLCSQKLKNCEPSKAHGH